MVKHEQFRSSDQLKRVASSGLATSLPLQLSTFHTTSSDITQRVIDPRAFDISSIKGRFAWEKLAPGDIYIPVIFRGTTKYFCVKILHKLLPEYPEDFIRRSSYYQYRKPLDLYVATLNELLLLNKINVHHCHREYSSEPFTIADQLIPVLDFLPFYEHLRLYAKNRPVSRANSSNSLRPILPQPQQSMQQSPDFIVHMPNTLLGSLTTPTATTSTSAQSFTTSEPSRVNNLSVPRQNVPVPSVLSSARLPKYAAQASATVRHSLHQQLVSFPSQQPTAASSHNSIHPKNTVVRNRSWSISKPTSSSQLTTSTAPLLPINPTPPGSDTSSPMLTSSRKLSITSTEKPSTAISKSISSSPAASKSPRLHSGWLQINKLYTPYLSNSTSNHHLYKIPVSLLTFYDLLKLPSVENNPNEAKDSSYSFEQTRVTPQEIELINSLCLKQSIKPFSIDTKLISLSTFYQYSSANILFVKELPLKEPKASICKDWSSIVQINGGICRLRNITSLHERTVPYVGNNLLKSFIISPQSLAAASLTTPTIAELEFLQLVAFLSNISVNLHNAKLIDIKSVQQEYIVDLILVFNDKFPLNVLDYQHQGGRPSTTKQQVNNQHDSQAATNTFAQSTPPPSPLSPATNNIHPNPTAQLPLTCSSPSLNRFQKTITFHGHTLTAYICSGLASNAQRECISVRGLCDVLYPNSSIPDKLEVRLLRLLRLKNINRFRPQNQQTMGFTRLVDVKDIEKHWDHIQQEMCSSSNNDAETNVVQEVNSSLSDKDSKASKLDKGGNDCEKVGEDTTMEVTKGEKRPLERDVYNEGEVSEDMPTLERMAKRTRSSAEDSNEQSQRAQVTLTKTTDKQRILSNDQSEDDDDDDEILLKSRRNSALSIHIVPKKSKKKPIRRPLDRLASKPLALCEKPALESIKKKIQIRRRRPKPCIRTCKDSVAAWVTKYNIEDCCIRLDLYNPTYDTEKD